MTSRHVETNQLIYRGKQLTGFYMITNNGLESFLILLLAGEGPASHLPFNFRRRNHV